MVGNRQMIDLETWERIMLPAAGEAISQGRQAHKEGNLFVARPHYTEAATLCPSLLEADRFQSCIRCDVTLKEGLHNHRQIA
jgi:hypothetical protein